MNNSISREYRTRRAMRRNKRASLSERFHAAVESIAIITCVAASIVIGIAFMACVAHYVAQQVAA